MNVRRGVEGDSVLKETLLKGRKGKILRAVMGAIIPRGGAFGPGAGDFDLVPRAEEILRGFDPSIRMLFPIILSYVQLTSIFRTGRPFTGLSEERGAAFLGSMETSPFYYRRMMMLLLKLITMLTFYEDDENARLAGYEHGCG